MSFNVSEHSIYFVKIIYEDDAIFVADEGGNNYYIKFHSNSKDSSFKNITGREVYLLKTNEKIVENSIDEKYEVNNFRYYLDKSSERME